MYTWNLEKWYQFSSVTQLCLTLCDPMNRSMPGLPAHHNSWSLPKLMSMESVMPSKHLILCCPLLLLSSVFPNIRVFSNESALPIRWPKYWRFSFNISPSKEHPRLISFRMDWLDLLAVQRTQAPPSMGFSRQEYWSGLPFPSPGDLPYSGMEPASLVSPVLAGMSFQHYHKLGSLIFISALLSFLHVIWFAS